MSESRLVNYSDILTIIRDLVFSFPTMIINEGMLFDGITFDLDRSKESEIVFYHLHEGDAAFLKLKKRLEKSTFGLLVITSHSEIVLSTLQQSLGALRIMLVKEQDFMEAQHRLLNHFYPLDLISRKFKLVAITGTNGKTSTAYFAYQLALQKGRRACCLGTLGVFDKENRHYLLDSGLTTPPLIELHKWLYRLSKELGHEVCFMETSSHALKLKRLYGFKFDVGGWTNFKQDHLDFHQTMDDYLQSKLLLPQEYLLSPENFFISEGDLDLEKSLKEKNISFKVVEKLQTNQIPSFLSLDFNRKNLSLAEKIVNLLFGDDKFDYHKIAPVPGRMESCEIAGCKIFIDFAHTPDALENILLETKKIFTQHKIVLLFGCGGNRDKGKRSLMGAVASKLSDQIYLTSDNPRNEDPQEIIQQILEGIKDRSNVLIELDRKEAIKRAIDGMDDNSVLIVAGKGAEKYQIIGDQKIAYNDLEYILELKRLKEKI